MGSSFHAAWITQTSTDVLPLAGRLRGAGSVTRAYGSSHVQSALTVLLQPPSTLTFGAVCHFQLSVTLSQDAFSLVTYIPKNFPGRPNRLYAGSRLAHIY